MAKQKKYTVRYELDPDSGWWVATVPEVAGCLTQGKSLRQAESRIREALALCLGDEAAEAAELERDIRLPPDLKRAVQRLSSSAAELRKVERAKSAAAVAAVKALTEAGFSLRDQAELLELSHQRVAQIAEGGE